MPAQPVWYHRLDDILTELEELQTVYLDRLAVEKLFGVHERRARQIMSGLPAIRVGNAVAVERLALIRFLKGVGGGERFQWEMNRRRRLTEELERSRRQLAARSVSIPTAPDPLGRMAVDLAEGTQLRPGELRIAFDGAEDLAAKLFQLSQVMANDWSAFREAAEAASNQGFKG